MNKLSDIQKQRLKILEEIEKSGSILMIFMHSYEIKLCNQMVKDGLLYKGKLDQIGATTSFFITDEGIKFLENQK